MKSLSGLSFVGVPLKPDNDGGGSSQELILTSLERVNRKRRGEEIDEEAARVFRKMMIDKYDREAHPSSP